jgi:hypothetical protein
MIRYFLLAPNTSSFATDNAPLGMYGFFKKKSCVFFVKFNMIPVKFLYCAHSQAAPSDQFRCKSCPVKILTKILTSMLKKQIGNIIDVDQNASWKGDQFMKTLSMRQDLCRPPVKVDIFLLMMVDYLVPPPSSSLLPQSSLSVFSPAWRRNHDAQVDSVASHGLAHTGRRPAWPLLIRLFVFVLVIAFDLFASDHGGHGRRRRGGIIPVGACFFLKQFALAVDVTGLSL